MRRPTLTDLHRLEAWLIVLIIALALVWSFAADSQLDKLKADIAGQTPHCCTEIGCGELPKPPSKVR